MENLWNNDAKFLANIFKSYNHDIRIVGGAVRDAIMGMIPHDIDFVSNATPMEMLQLAQEKQLRTVVSLDDVLKNPDLFEKGGLKHGTITFIRNGVPYEITTLRIDLATDGRHAEVEFIRDFEKDASRRDFTINAMMMDASGKIYDYHNGLEHIQQKKIVFVGDANKRIQEDYLRILRYFRFKAKISSDHQDKDVLEIIKNNLAGLDQISGERIQQEMMKILASHSGLHQLNSMREIGLLDRISFLITDIENAMKVSEKANIACRLGMLLDGEKDIEQMSKRWRLGVKDTALASFVQKYRHLRDEKIDVFFDLLTDNPRIKIESGYQLLLAFGRDQDAEFFGKHYPVFPLVGDDFLSMGYISGKDMGEAVHEMKMIWKNSNYQMTKDELIIKAQEYLTELNERNSLHMRPGR